MNDDNDTDSGGDFFVDTVKAVIGVGFIALLVVTVGAAIWEFVL
jgi:hypothetical protein